MDAILSNRGLSLRELRTSALICFRNAEELLSDAKLLFSNRRFGRTVFLSCIGTEELGKSVFCFDLYKNNYQFDTENKINEFWDFWIHHFSKTIRGMGYEYLFPFKLKRPRGLSGSGDKANLPNVKDKDEEFYFDYSSNTLDLKEYALYVNVNEKDNKLLFVIPSMIFNLEDAEHFIQTFEERIEELRPRIESLGTLDLKPYPGI